jgi:hypothetical protein
MTTKERVLTAFARREPDRPPINSMANPGIDARLKRNFGLAALKGDSAGYMLAALTRLPLLCLDSGAEEFRLEAVATARTAGRTEHRRAALVFAVEHACRDSVGFGRAQVTCVIP